MGSSAFHVILGEAPGSHETANRASLPEDVAKLVVIRDHSAHGICDRLERDLVPRAQTDAAGLLRCVGGEPQARQRLGAAD